MRVAYNGHEALTFTDYLDLESGKTLHAKPGGTYDIAPASGRVVPEVPEPWFTAVQWSLPETGDSTEVQVETAEAVEAGEDAPDEGDEVPAPSGQ